MVYQHYVLDAHSIRGSAVWKHCSHQFSIFFKGVLHWAYQPCTGMIIFLLSMDSVFLYLLTHDLQAGGDTGTAFGPTGQKGEVFVN